MFCKKCGNELLKNDKYCGKCGAKTNNSITPKQLIIILTVITLIIMFLFIMIITNNKTKEKINSNLSNANTSSSIKKEETTENKINSTTDTTNKHIKKYFDFIDTDYYTFNFTEQELLSILLEGKTYNSAGFIKSASTNDSNTTLYAKQTYDSNTRLSGVETISITTNSSNYKVKKFSFSFISNNTLTEESSNFLGQMYLLMGTSSLLGEHANNVDEDELGKLLTNYRNNIYEGLTINTKQETKLFECEFQANK